jgi:2-(1,2-epoxy-1,2-dihydrophenyl)acetyl-CoA isomerase
MTMESNMSGYQTLLLEDRGPVRIITLNRPEQFNPLDIESGPELVDALERADRDKNVRALVLTGAGKAFSAGGNVRLMGEGLARGDDPAEFFCEVAAVLNRTIITLRRHSKPIVCAMNGVASGGGLGWALSCDLIVMAKNAKFDPGYIRIAVNPDGGASVLISRLIGAKRAAAFFMLGQPINSQNALEWGMVNQVVEEDQVLESALALAGQLAQGPLQAMASTKALINQALFGDLEGILENERRAILELCQKPDFAEGIKAFFEKRKPKFA